MTPTTIGGRYDLGPRLGSGGMADVVEAMDRRLDRRVAVKLMRADVSDPRARQRFEHEAMVAAALSHPNVVAVYDVGEHDGVPYIVMELVEGTTLAALLHDHGALAPRDAGMITDQVLRALEAAHAQGLVHRDVKPGNVLIAPDGTAKLADFGIAKAMASPSLTQTGQVIGTPRYLSPEQLAGHEATEQSDLYAVGVMLYEMLAGEPPFATESFTALAAAHQLAPVPSLAEQRPGLPAALVTTAEHALAKDPADRFADARTMRRSLAGTPRDLAAVTTAVDGPAQTALLPDPAAPPAAPEPSRRGRERRARRLWPALVAGALIGAAALAAVLLATGGGDDPGAAGATSTTAVRVAASPTTHPPSTTSTTLPPQTVAELITLLSTDPAAFGERGDDLLRLLEDMVERPDRAGRDAATAIDEIQTWVDDGELSPLLGAQATTILTPIAATSDQGHGNGKGKNGFGGD